MDVNFAGDLEAHHETAWSPKRAVRAGGVTERLVSSYVLQRLRSNMATQRRSCAEVPGTGSAVVRCPHPILRWAIYFRDLPMVSVELKQSSYMSQDRGRPVLQDWDHSGSHCKKLTDRERTTEWCF